MDEECHEKNATKARTDLMRAKYSCIRGCKNKLIISVYILKHHQSI